jgi:NAD(P)-dependent dehydrogenase (short-subunit alcohol dehydrogenase family)
MLLRSKVALITGSATGIGQGIAQHFSTEGSAVVLVDRDDVRNRAAAVELEASGARTLAISLDLRDRSAIRAAVERAQRELGLIDD